MDKHDAFEQERRYEIARMGKNDEFRSLSSEWFIEATYSKYSYHFDFLGRPIIQYPQDMIAIQELIWKIKPDLIVETGIAHGGSLIQSAAMLALIELSEAITSNKFLDPRVSKRRVIAVDIDIRTHNRVEIENHPLSSRITLIEGSSIDPSVIAQIKDFARNYTRVMVFLDSNHTHTHVLSELKAYADLVSIGSYVVVFDTVIEDLPEDANGDRPWGPGNNPLTAVREFLASDLSFEVDESIHNKLLITVAPNGFLKRLR